PPRASPAEPFLAPCVAPGHSAPAETGRPPGAPGGGGGPAGPAGGICASASDVARFAALHLAGGRVGDENVLSAESVQAMQTPQIAVPSGGDGLSPRHWGLGWEIFDWGGRTVLGPDGGAVGA